jgi:hypothetical protein
MQLASASVVSGPSAAIARSRTTEIKMRAYSLSELFSFTRSELFALHSQIVGNLWSLSDTDRETALETLRNLRRVLTQMRAGP